VTQHINIGDRFTTIGEHRNVDQHPATVMARSEQTARHRLGQLDR